MVGNMKLVKEIKELVEGTWEIPSTVKQAKRLAKLMQKPLSFKAAPNKLSGLVGDDDLFDFFIEMEDAGEGKEDARKAIMDQVKKWVKGKNKTKDEWDEEAIKILNSIKVK